jgi:hypothetical protein
MTGLGWNCNYIMEKEHLRAVIHSSPNIGILTMVSEYFYDPEDKM